MATPQEMAIQELARRELGRRGVEGFVGPPTPKSHDFEARIREGFAGSNKEFEMFTIFDEMEKLENDPRYLSIDRGSAYDRQGNLRDSIRVQVPALQGGGRSATVSIKGLKDRIAAHRTLQQDLLDEVEESGEEAKFLDRQFAGVKMGPEGRFSFLQESYGEENVRPVFDKDDKLQSVIILGHGPPKVFDSRRTTWKDLADLSGDGIEIAADIGAAALIGRIPGAKATATARVATEGAGAAIGSTIRQLFSSMLPGEDFPGEDEAAQRLMAVGVNVGGALGFRGLGAASRRLSASGLLGEGVPGFKGGALGERLPQTIEEAHRGTGPTARELAERPIELGPPGTSITRTISQIAQEADTPLSKSEQLQSPLLAQVEGFLHAMPGGRSTLQPAQVDRIRRLAKFGDKQIDSLTGGSRVGSVDAGQALAEVVARIRKEILDLRSKLARKQYGAVDQATGGAPVIDMTPTADALREIIDQFDTRLGLDDAALRKARDMLDKIEGKAQPSPILSAAGEPIGTEASSPFFSVLDAQKERASFLSKAKGNVPFADDVPISRSKAIYFRLADAIGDSLQVAERDATNELGQAGVAALREANQGWARHSGDLAAMDTAILKQVARFEKLGAPSKIPGSLLRYQPEQVETLVGLLKDKAPHELQMLRGATMRDMLESAIKGVEDPAVRPGAFARAFADKEPQIRALFKDSPKQFANIKMAAVLAERISKNKELVAGARTGPLLLIAWGLTNPPKAVIAMLGAKRLARMLIDPDMSTLLLKPPPGALTTGLKVAEATGEVAGQLGVLAARDEFFFPDIEDKPEENR